MAAGQRLDGLGSPAWPLVTPVAWTSQVRVVRCPSARCASLGIEGLQSPPRPAASTAFACSSAPQALRPLTGLFVACPLYFFYARIASAAHSSISSASSGISTASLSRSMVVSHLPLGCLGVGTRPAMHPTMPCSLRSSSTLRSNLT